MGCRPGAFGFWLLACGNYLKQCAAWEEEDVTEFYNYRRPKPPSLKEQALEDLDSLIADLANHGMGFKITNILRALEQLPDNEQALDLLDKAEDPSWDINDFSIIRRVLELLDD
jgi:hypothetical protein